MVLIYLFIHLFIFPTKAMNKMHLLRWECQVDKFCFFFVIPLGSYEGGWASYFGGQWHFLQIDLGNVTMVTAIATQGHSANAWWVTKYSLDYGNEDGNFTAYNNGQASNTESIDPHT